MAIIVGVFVLVLLAKLPGAVGFFLIPLMVLGRPVAVVVLAIWAGPLLVRGRPRTAASLVAAASLTVVLWKPICWAADCVHVPLRVRFGIGLLGSQPTPSGDRFAAYDWSVGLAGGPNTFLLRDPTDEIALPLARHKHPIASEGAFAELCAGRVSHLFGHYYRCTF